MKIKHEREPDVPLHYPLVQEALLSQLSLKLNIRVPPPELTRTSLSEPSPRAFMNED
jgi:hypothetical protein